MTKPDSIVPAAASGKICLLVYGPPGVGKTTLIGSGGQRTLIVRPPTDHADPIVGSGVEEWVVTDWDDMNEVLDYARHEGGDDFDWIWLDSISSWQDHGLDDIWEATKAHNPNRDVKHAGLDKGEYGRNMDRIGRWVRHMAGPATFNLGITAWPTELPDDDGEYLLRPWVQGKNMPTKICGYMNIVGYYELAKRKDEEPVRVMRTQLSDRYYAKDQFNAFDSGRMVEPTMPKIIKSVSGARAPSPKRRATRRRRT